MRRSLPLALVSLLVCALVFSPAVAAPAGGVVGNGTGPSCNQTNLHNALIGGGTINFSCGGAHTITLNSHETISQNTVIDGADLITLTGAGSTRLFLVDSGVALTLRHILLDQGSSGIGDGGAIVNHGTLILDGSTIQNSNTDVNHSGGAIFSDGPVFITGSTLSNNNAGNGGALHAVTSSALVQVTDSTFFNNQAFDSLNGFGGAIWLSGLAQLTMNNPVFDFNQAENGGALYIAAGSAVTITASPSAASFFSNRAATAGGAINNQLGGSLATGGVLLRDNLAFTTTVSPSAGGGGIYSAGPLSLHQTYFDHNSGRHGGGLFVDGAAVGTTPIALDRTAFVNNFAQVSGGGLYLTGTASLVTLNDSLVKDNVAKTTAGGGIFRRNARLTILDSSIIDNQTAGGDGGGLYTSSSGGSATGGVVQVLDSTLSGNSGQSNIQGGGLYNNSAQVNLRNDTFAENDNATFNTGASPLLSTTNSVYWSVLSLNCDDTGPGIISLGGNYSGDMSCDGFTNSGDENNPGVDPLGSRLIDQLDAYLAIVYYLPKPGSSIINTALPVCSLHDQRHALRPNACDKGAVEFGGLLPRLFVPLVRR